MNSRLIGEIVEARLFSDYVEVWYGGQKVDQFPRLHGRTNYRVDYGTSSTGWCASLVPSPVTATASTCFRAASSGWVYDLLKEVMPNRCDRRYLQILEVAAKEGEARVEDALRLLLATESRQTDHRGERCVRSVPEALRTGAGDH